MGETPAHGAERVKGAGNMKRSTHRLFVYGTLKQGFRNHYYLAASNYLGKFVASNIAIINRPDYPYAVPKEGAKATGEIYELDRESLDKIDMLEDYDPGNANSHYRRMYITFEGLGRVWIYLIGDEELAERLATQYGLVDEWQNH
jgi:gamma-glutamylcyclotransferase (GGCT)/AIG2-like uncharacterized protein YtfP